MAFNQKEYKNNYEKENYYRPVIRIAKEKKTTVDDVALKTGKSISQLFVEAFEKQYKVDLSIPVEKLLRDNK